MSLNPEFEGEIANDHIDLILNINYTNNLSLSFSFLTPTSHSIDEAKHDALQSLKGNIVQLLKELEEYLQQQA